MEKKKVIIGILSLVLAIGMIVAIIIIATSGGSRPSDTTEPEDSFETLPSQVLDELLQAERGPITTAINTRFASFSSQFSISRMQLLGTGQYSVVTLDYSEFVEVAEYTRSDTYRLILLKENGQWQALGLPQLIFSYLDYPELPGQVIRAANAL